MHVISETRESQGGRDLALRVLDEASGAMEAWRAYAGGGRDAVLGARLEERLAGVLRAVAAVAWVEGLDMSRVVAGCPDLCEDLGRLGHGGVTSDGGVTEGAVGCDADGEADMPDVATSESPVEHVAGLGSPLSSENALWVTDPEPRIVFVRGRAVPDGGDEWTFGAEWNGNVARHVSFLRTSSRPSDGTAETVVLFNDAFDANAVDVRAADGRTHVVLAQGLGADSFGSAWEGVRSRFLRYERASSDEDTVVILPAVSVEGSAMGDGPAREIFRMARASVPVIRDGQVVGELDGTGDGPSDADGTGSRATDGSEVASWDISFNDAFWLFAYAEPFDGYDASRDFTQVGEPEMALLLTDIKLFQCQAERLTDYDPDWGKDTIS